MQEVNNKSCVPNSNKKEAEAKFWAVCYEDEDKNQHMSYIDYRPELLALKKIFGQKIKVLCFMRISAEQYKNGINIPRD